MQGCKGQNLDENILENMNSVKEDEIGPPILREEFDEALTGLKDHKAP